MQDEDDVAFAAGGAANGHPAPLLTGVETPEDLAVAERRQHESNRISDALGAKLLQGWTMLAEHCPRCGIDIMMRSHMTRKGLKHSISAGYGLAWHFSQTVQMDLHESEGQNHSRMSRNNHSSQQAGLSFSATQRLVVQVPDTAGAQPRQPHSMRRLRRFCAARGRSPVATATSCHNSRRRRKEHPADS